MSKRNRAPDGAAIDWSGEVPTVKMGDNMRQCLEHRYFFTFPDTCTRCKRAARRKPSLT